TFVNSTISGNTATGSGGFISSFLVSGLSVTITQCTLTQNSSAGSFGSFHIGGGALAFFVSSGTVNINQSTIADNAVTNTGGAIGVSSGSMYFYLTSSIISQNKVAGSTLAANSDIGATPGAANFQVNYT